MDRIDIKDVAQENLEDLCWLCVPPQRRDSPDFVRGVDEKRRWTAEMLSKWGPFARLAYEAEAPVGMIQFRPVPEERVVHIDCTFVPREECLRKGIATRLLSSLIDDAGQPMRWFDNKPALALVTRTFPGEMPPHYGARGFFSRRGFGQIGADPDHMYYPLTVGYVYRPPDKKEVGYIPQDEDRGKAVIICGPNGCPFTYPYFLRTMEKHIREINPGTPIRWIDSSEEPSELTKRNVHVGDCIVNASPVKSFVLNKEGFQREVRDLLGDE
jgi:GNAT superfamily N-acetyltransferase